RRGAESAVLLCQQKFTLVATVSVHEVPKADSSISLMGVKLHGTGHAVLFGLSYTNENKCGVTFNGKSQNLLGDPNWLQGETYRVAPGMDRYAKELVVYVDGPATCESEKYYEDYEKLFAELKAVLGFHSASQLYIGGTARGNGRHSCDGERCPAVKPHNEQCQAQGADGEERCWHSRGEGDRLERRASKQQCERNPSLICQRGRRHQ
ncbi:trans-sialidase, putative, partial [Trypanosoma cruzi marinkellei]